MKKIDGILLLAAAWTIGPGLILLCLSPSIPPPTWIAAPSLSLLGFGFLCAGVFGTRQAIEGWKEENER